MSHYFPLSTCLYVPILISDLCCLLFSQFHYLGFIEQKFVILFNSNFLCLFYYFHDNFRILLGLKINYGTEEERLHY